MKLDEDLHLDEQLLDLVLVVFVLSPFHFFRGGGVLFWDSEYKKPPI